MISMLRRTGFREQDRMYETSTEISGESPTYRCEMSIAELAGEVSTDLDGAYWSYMLEAELEDAFDTALLRAAMSETPILAGAVPAWSSQLGAMLG